MSPHRSLIALIQQITFSSLSCVGASPCVVLDRRKNALWISTDQRRYLHHGWRLRRSLRAPNKSPKTSSVRRCRPRLIRLRDQRNATEPQSAGEHGGLQSKTSHSVDAGDRTAPPESQQLLRPEKRRFSHSRCLRTSHRPSRSACSVLPRMELNAGWTSMQELQGSRDTPSCGC